jgi:hypothetical protein
MEESTMLPEILDMEQAFGNVAEGERPDATQMTFVLTIEQGETVKAALASAKKMHGFDLDTGNKNSNGNALALIAEDWIRVRG